MNLQHIRQSVRRLLCLSLATAMVCIGVVVSLPAPATAMNEAGNVVKERAEREFDRKTQAGSSDRVEGQVKQNIGRAQRQFGDSSEGMGKQMEGKAQETMGKAKQQAQDFSEDVQEKSDSVVDSIRDFFD